jgi:hypothetical protein
MFSVIPCTYYLILYRSLFLSVSALMLSLDSHLLKAYFSKIQSKNGAGIVQRHRAGLRAGRSGVRVPARTANFLFTTPARRGLRSTQHPIQRVPGGSLPGGVKRPGRESDHSPQSSAEVKNAGSLPPLPQYVFMAWCSIKAQGQFYLLPFPKYPPLQ